MDNTVMDRPSVGKEGGSDLSVFDNFHVSLSCRVHIAIMFYAIGLGLADEKDVSVKGLEIIKRAERVYLEAYTAVLLVEKEVLVRNFSHCMRKRALIAIAVGSLLWPPSNHRRP